MRLRILKSISSIIPWSILIMLKGFGAFTFFGIRMDIRLGVIASILSVVFPSIFDVGVSDWKEASMIAKLSPIVILIVYIFVMKAIGQSYATVIVCSFFLGFLFTYLGKVIDSTLK